VATRCWCLCDALPHDTDQALHEVPDANVFMGLVEHDQLSEELAVEGGIAKSWSRTTNKRELSSFSRNSSRRSTMSRRPRPINELRRVESCNVPERDRDGGWRVP